MEQSHLLVDSFENAKGLLSEIIPYKILETILCQNFGNRIVFWDFFAHHSRVRYGIDSKPSPFSTEIICAHF